MHTSSQLLQTQPSHTFKNQNPDLQSRVHASVYNPNLSLSNKESLKLQNWMSVQFGFNSIHVNQSATY
jgi:hypothetical protein